MVASADQYPWSSHAGNTGTLPDPLLHPHDCYQRLGTTPSDRQQAYRELVQQATAEDASRFAHHLHHQQPMGNDRFRAAIETQLGRGITPRKVGRPRRQPEENPTSEDRGQELI